MCSESFAALVNSTNLCMLMQESYLISEKADDSHDGSKSDHHSLAKLGARVFKLECEVTTLGYQNGLEVCGALRKKHLLGL